jgi:hypothetical protein
MYDDWNYKIEELQYIYNKTGKLAAESTYRSDNTLLVRYVYTYTKKGKLMRTDIHVPIPEVYSSSSYEFTYNSKGEPEEQRTYNR